MTDDQSGPRPWFGCDKNSEAWRRYCEAWEHVFRPKGQHLRSMIQNGNRGPEALALLDRCIKVVKRDYRGEIDDRSELPRLLR